jgi:hypothetical protein
MVSISKNRRSIKERVEAIFDFISAQGEAFAKSNFKKIGLNPAAAEKWLNIIVYIQNQPKIRVLKTGHNTIIEKIEGKYHTVLMKRITNEKLSFEERLKSLTDYLGALYAREQIGIERLKKRGD